MVLDLGLPDTTGFDVCRKIREGSEVPILFLTARDSEVDRVLGLEMGGDDYVTKPFSPARGGGADSGDSSALQRKRKKGGSGGWRGRLRRCVLADRSARA